MPPVNARTASTTLKNVADHSQAVEPTLASRTRMDKDIFDGFNGCNFDRFAVFEDNTRRRGVELCLVTCPAPISLLLRSASKAASGTSQPQAYGIAQPDRG